MKAEDKRVCQVCGTPFPAASDFCPVCVLRGAVGDDQATSELVAGPTPSLSELRFGHYEVLAPAQLCPRFYIGRLLALVGRHSPAGAAYKGKVGSRRTVSLVRFYANIGQDNLPIAPLTEWMVPPAAA